MGWSLPLCIMCFFVCGTNGNSFQHHTLQRVMNGYYSELISFTLEAIHSDSVPKCCVNCSTNTNCLSVVFNSDSGQCVMLSKTISLLDTSKPDLPSNIQAFTKPSLKCSDVGYHVSNDMGDRCICFRANYDKKTKQEAEVECSKEKGSIVQIDSGLKHSAILQFIQDGTQRGSAFLVDGSDEAVEDDWRLSDGRPPYLVWRAGEPAICCKGYEDCVVIYNDGTMNDVPCSLESSFLCEKQCNDAI